MAIKYAGATAWTLQAEQQSGITDDGKVFQEITYLGNKNLRASFRNSWVKGDACPIAGREHLTLVTSPTITEGRAMAWATLRFEGADVTGEFGDHSDTLHKEDQAEEVNLQSPNGLKGTYEYYAPVVVRTYTSDTERSEPKSPPSMSDPIPLRKVAGDGLGAEALVAANTPDSPLWEVVTISKFVSIDYDGSAWVHEEFHTKSLGGVAR